MVNEALATVSLDDVYIPLDLSKGLYDRTKYGINYPYIFPVGKEVQNRIPTLSIPNFSDLNGGPYPSHSSGPIYDFSDNLTKVAGTIRSNSACSTNDLAKTISIRSTSTAFPAAQTTKMAGSIHAIRGQRSTGVGVANAALGLFDVYAEIGQRAYTIYRGSMWEWFAQDSMEGDQSLTLNYGLRHTIIIPFSAHVAEHGHLRPGLLRSGECGSAESDDRLCHPRHRRPL